MKSYHFFMYVFAPHYQHFMRGNGVVREGFIPPEEDIKKLERRVKAQEKKMAKKLKGWEGKEEGKK